MPERQQFDFNDFCPEYHELDRVGVVSPFLEDGILYTGFALLALTTAFYDRQRACSSDFFTYPQHFAFIGANNLGVSTCIGPLISNGDQGDQLSDESELGRAWGWLDVWPSSQWITATATPASMLKKVFEFQISRLFWPWDFRVTENDETLSAVIRKLLRARLKSVYYYNAPSPNIALRVSQPVAETVKQSINRLPLKVLQHYQQVPPERPQLDVGHRGSSKSLPSDLHMAIGAHPGQTDGIYVEKYVQVKADHFLEDMSNCFI